MLKKIYHTDMGKSDLGWLHSTFHFSFSSYYNPDNVNFGVLRVLNDDLIEPASGFDLHPHNDMEIITYVVEGELTHGDSMGNSNTIGRGHVQYMSAGTGIYHSEHNRGKVTTRLLQVWILPDKEGLKPEYGDFRFDWEERKNRWFHFVSGKKGEAPIKINADANFYALELDEGKKTGFPVPPGRQAYLVQIEGSSLINGSVMQQRDAMEIVGENISIEASETSHFLLIEMEKG